MQLNCSFRLEADQARLAWEHVLEADRELEEKEKKAYRSLIRAAGADILGSGLGQTMAFYASKVAKNGELPLEKAHGRLFDHIARFLQERGLIPDTGDRFKDFFSCITQELTFSQHRLLLRAALGYVSWSKRFAESILPKPD